MASTVAVTGGTGFVGRAVIAKLLDIGHDVVALGRVADRALPVLAGHPRAAAVRLVAVGDLADADYGSALPAGMVAVIHCAARVHVMRDAAADPLFEFRRANVDATLALARHAAQRGVARFVYLSSIKVNGESTAPGRPFRGDDPPAPRDPYAVSKMEAEAGLRVIAETTGLGVTVIRPPLVYGPGVKGNFATLSKLVRSGLPLPLGGITGNRRSLVAVGNLADLVAHCATDSGVAGQTLLAADGRDLSTTELLRLMATAMGRRARLIAVPPAALRGLARLLGRADAAERLCGSLQVDNGPARQLGWSPPLSVEEGMTAAFADQS